MNGFSKRNSCKIKEFYKDDEKDFFKQEMKEIEQNLKSLNVRDTIESCFPEMKEERLRREKELLIFVCPDLARALGAINIPDKD